MPAVRQAAQLRGWAPAVREARAVTRSDAQRVLSTRSGDRNRGVEAQHLGRDHRRRLVDALDALEERRDEIGAREVGRRKSRREQGLNRRRQHGVGDVVGELGDIDFGLEALNLSLSSMPMISSLTSGIPRRDT